MQSRQRFARISTAQVDGCVVVQVIGAELFDLIDDHFTALTDIDFRVKFPDPDARGSATHELYFAPEIALDKILDVLDQLPIDEVNNAQRADGAI
jgi:hypothetical protein